MENKNISLNFFRKQTLKFKLFFLFSITFSIVLFLIDSISIILVLPVIFNFDAINLSNIIYVKYVPEIFFTVLRTFDYKTIVIIFIIILFLRNILNILQNLLNFSFDKYLEIQISKKILDLYLRKNLLKFYGINSNDLIKDLRESIIGYSLYVGSYLRFFSELILLVLLIFFLFSISFLQTAIISTFFIFIIIFFRFFFFKSSEEIGKSANLYSSQLNLQIIELNRNFIEIILRKLKKIYLNKYLSILYKYSNSRLLAVFFKTTTKQFFEIFILFFSAIAIIVFANTGNLTKNLPLIIIYLIAAYRILPLVNNVAANLIKIKNFKYSFNIIQKKINEHNSKYSDFINDSTFDRKLDFKRSIKLNNISFKYNNNRNLVFKNLNMEIKKNQMIGIIGESGSGKSTLLKIIMGLIEPNYGKIILDNNEIQKNNLNAFQSLLGFLGQENILINDTIKNNVAFGDPRINVNKVKRSLHLANCKFIRSKFKNNLNYVIKEHGKNFSIGQLQRIGLARMLYFDNDIFILDEPTSALDKKSELKFINLIKKFKNYKTIIISTHKKIVLQNCDKIYEVKNKKLKQLN